MVHTVQGESRIQGCRCEDSQASIDGALSLDERWLPLGEAGFRKLRRKIIAPEAWARSTSSSSFKSMTPAYARPVVFETGESKETVRP